MDGSLNQLLASTRPDFSKLPGGWEPPSEIIPTLSTERRNIVRSFFPIEAQLLYNVLSEADCAALISLMGQSPNIESVSIQGRKDVPSYGAGSTRTTIWSPHLSRQIWKKIGLLIPGRGMSPLSATDWWQGDKERYSWFPVAMSPLLRFMRYDKGGQHYAHYDAGFIYQDDKYRTLQSVVIYLTTNRDGGETRFIRDGQENVPIWDRTHQDWVRETKENEVMHTSHPERGKVLVFDHRLCHDVGLYAGSDPRIIIRGDIVFTSEITDELEN